MVEGLAEVAIVSGFVQLVDFTSKVDARPNNVQAGTNDIPKSLCYSKAELRVLLLTLQQIHDAIEARHFPQDSTAALLLTLQGCDHSIHDIESMITKALPKHNDRLTKRIVNSVGSNWKRWEDLGTMATLLGYIETPTFTASSSMLQPGKGRNAIKDNN
jgi:hypothetical protein